MAENISPRFLFLPLKIPPGWQGMPVTPARIRWRILRAGTAVVPWQVAVDHNTSFHPNVQGNPASDLNFDTIYAPDTTQNRPNAPGLFRFWLRRGFDTSQYQNGPHVLQVEATDVRGNPRTSNLAVVFTNAEPSL